jgi:hypothetical protein
MTEPRRPGFEVWRTVVGRAHGDVLIPGGGLGNYALIARVQTGQWAEAKK